MLNEKALLVRLNISQWTGRKKDKRISRETNSFYGADSNAGYYNKLLITKTAIKDIQKAVGAARTFHYENTLPWGDNGERLLPAANYLNYTRKMSELKGDFETAVSLFKRHYPVLIVEARQNLSKMFNPADYPDANLIDSKYAFMTEVTPVPSAADFRVDLANDEAENIRKSIEQQTRQAQAEAMRDLWDRLYDVVYKMSDKLSEKDGIFRDSLVGNVVKLTEILPRLNVTEDTDLDKLCREVRSRLCNRTPKELRTNPEAKKETAYAANALLESMAGYMGNAA